MIIVSHIGDLSGPPKKISYMDSFGSVDPDPGPRGIKGRENQSLRNKKKLEFFAGNYIFQGYFS